MSLQWLIQPVAHLSGLDGSCQLFPQDRGVIGQVLVHHLVVWEEEQIGFGAFNGFFVIPICKEKRACSNTSRSIRDRANMEKEEKQERKYFLFSKGSPT